MAKTICDPLAKSRLVDEQEVHSVTPTLLGLHDELKRLKRAPVFGAQRGGLRLDVHFEGKSLWLVVRWKSGACVAFCAAWSGGGAATLREPESNAGKFRCALQTMMGRYDVEVEFGGARPVLHWRTTLTPKVELRIPNWPADIYPIADGTNKTDTRGVVHAKQQGSGGAFLYCSLTRPAAASLLYLQNLTALNGYFEKTGTNPSDRMTARWPELGFVLPPIEDRPLPSNQPTVISDAFVRCATGAPQDDLGAAREFLELYADVYLAMPRPEPLHRDWPRRVDETLQDLTHSPACYVEHKGHKYLRAYVGVDDRPPESTVQLAVLIPLVEYMKSRGVDIDLAKDLSANIPTFYDPKIRSVTRWLHGATELMRRDEEHMRENLMDSWYLYHTHLNLARLATFGDKTAQRLFLESVEYAIKAAQHFDYRWPVFYDIYTFEVIKAEREQGRGGEQDVGAQYVHLMQQAWELTRKRRYVEEAERAARELGERWPWSASPAPIPRARRKA